MLISLNWLTDYVDVAMPARELADLFTRIGLNCEEIIESESDIVFDLEVTSNRPDWLGHLGVARELAAATGAEFRRPEIPDLPTTGRVEDLTAVQVDEPSLCPRYTARVVRNVQVGPSPQWLVERLEAVGLRAVNNIVDVTNYVLMEYSQPLHGFDYDKLAEHRIVVRRGREGEEITSIDGTRCRLDTQMCVIADAEKAVAIAGIMGGLNTEVDEGTTNVLIEAARFDPLTTRRTSRKLQLMSESNYRFERGVDPVAVDEAGLRACRLILDVAGGELAEGVADVWAQPYEAPEVSLRPARCDALLGVDIPAERQADLLGRLGLSPRIDGERIVCTIPPHRADLRREADLIEEVARLHGYDEIPELDRVAHAVEPEHLPQRTRRRVGELLTAAGFDEAITFSFVDDDEAELFGCREFVRVDPDVRRTNNVLRPSLIPSLLRAMKVNQDAGNEDVSLFELAAVFPHGGASGFPDERVEIALASTRDVRAVRGAVEALVSGVAGRDVTMTVEPATVGGLDDGLAGEIRIDGEAVGMIGSMGAEALDRYGLRPDRRIATASIRFDALLSRAGGVRIYEPVPRFPAVERDLSIIVDEDVPWRRLREAIEDVEQPMRVGVDYVTTYRGKPVSAGRKSVTITLTYRSEAGTLRGEQVDQQVEQVIAALRNALAAELRG